MLRMKAGDCNCAQCQFVAKAEVFSAVGKRSEIATVFPIDLTLTEEENFKIMDARATVLMRQHHNHQWH